MKRSLIIFFILLSFSFGYSINLNILKKAENYYRNGNYEKALEIYKSLEKEYPNYEIYYNLGNIYFKLKKYPLSKLYYLRAYKIKQNDKDLLHNLRAVEMRLEDRIKLPEEDPFTKLLNVIKNAFSLNTYLTISVIVLFFISIFFFFLKGKIKLYFIYPLIFIFLILLIIDIVKINEYYKDIYVLLTPKIEVKSEPSRIGTTVFIIHEGIDFEVKQKVGEWYLIVLKNGYRGWIKAAENKDFLKV